MRLRYVQSFVDRKIGTVFHYFRRRGFPRVRLPGIPGSKEFMAAYQRALDGPQMPIGASRTKAGTINAAIIAYYQSRSFAELAPGTQAMRRAIYERLRAEHGDRPVDMPAKFINLTLDKLKPHAARNWFKAIRALMAYAVKADMMAANPTAGISPPKVKSVKHLSWPAAVKAQYEAAHPIGIKARLCFALARYTGAGRAEIARMGPQNIINGEIVISRQKTGVTATIPIHPELRAVIEATPITGLATFLVTKTGKQFAPNDLSDQFRQWCDEADIPNVYSLHGLRHAMGDALAETGANPNEIGAILGHASAKTSLHYTQGADRQRMARKAMAKLVEND